MRKLYQLTDVHPITNQLLIKETIHLGLGIIPESKPFSLVTFNEKSMYHKYTVNRVVSSMLIKWEVPQVTGMSIKELLDLPIHELQNLVDVVKEHTLAKAKKTNNLTNKLADELKIE